MEEIAAELGLPVEKIIEANRTAADTLSLDTPVGDEEDTSIGSFVEDERTPGPADATSNALLAEALGQILNTLTDREADVLRLRFGIAGIVVVDRTNLCCTGSTSHQTCHQTRENKFFHVAPSLHT